MNPIIRNWKKYCKSMKQM